MLTTELTGSQWLVCLGLAGIFAAAVEIEKAWRRRAGRHRRNTDRDQSREMS